MVVLGDSVLRYLNIWRHYWGVATWKAHPNAMHHPCTNPCTAQLAGQLQHQFDPTRGIHIGTTWYCCYLNKSLTEYGMYLNTLIWITDMSIIQIAKKGPPQSGRPNFWFSWTAIQIDYHATSCMCFQWCPYEESNKAIFWKVWFLEKVIKVASIQTCRQLRIHKLGRFG